MARRVLMATATSGEPKLIIADEPTPGIHPEVLADTMKQFREMADRGQASYGLPMTLLRH